MTILSDRVKLNKKQQEKPHKKDKIVQGLFIRVARPSLRMQYTVFKKGSNSWSEKVKKLKVADQKKPLVPYFFTLLQQELPNFFPKYPKIILFGIVKFYHVTSNGHI